MICIECKQDLLGIDFRPQDFGVCIKCSGYKLESKNNLGVFGMRTHAKNGGTRGRKSSISTPTTKFGQNILGIN